HACVAELFLEAFGHEVHAAFATNIFPENEELLVRGELAAQRAAHRFREANDLRPVCRRRLARERRTVSTRETAEGLRRSFGVVGIPPARDRRWIGVGTRARRVEACLDVAGDFGLERLPRR